MNNILLEKAIEYARRNWYVFPCREKEGKPFLTKKGKMHTPIIKSPYHKGGFKNATLDETIIKSWWDKTPEAAIGISCGASNLIVVDIDSHKDVRGYDNFMKLNVSDSGALHSMTPTGGAHIIYSGRTNSYANVKAGIDIRSEGAYFIAPPSYIYTKENERKAYIELDDWDRIPVKIPEDLLSKLDTLREKNKEVRTPKKEHPIENHDDLVRRAKKALEKLPLEYCDEYFKWIDVGLSLKSLGNDGFKLWDEWSMKSSKYDPDACEYRWDRFEPRDITIASLFFWAKENS